MSRQDTPPKWAMNFFRWFCREDLFEAVEGDLVESFYRHLESHGHYRARWIYIIRVLTFLRPFALKRKSRKTSLNPIEMLGLHLKFAFRNLKKTSYYSLVNIFSFGIGIAAVLLLMSFIAEELSYDKFHEDAESIYRFGYHIETDNQPTRRLAWVSALAGPAAQERYPEVEHMVRIRNCGGSMIGPDNNVQNENAGFFAGDEFFDVFSFELIRGNPEQTLDAPNKIVLTESMAQRYFGSQDPLGQPLQLVIGDTLNLQVSGVMQDTPDNSHFKFDYLISHKTREVIYPHIQGWFALGTHTYFKLNKEATTQAFEEKVSNLVMEAYGDEASSMGFNIQLFVQPLLDIHLKSKLSNEIQANGDIQYLIIAIGIGVVILLIASFNFANLFIARTSKLIKQVGVRKVLGANKKQLISQFVIEAGLSVFLTLCLAVPLAMLVLPYFEQLVARNLSIVWTGPLSVLALGLYMLLVAVFAGIYPSILLASVKTRESIGGKWSGSSKGNLMNKGLIVLQFAMATILISAVLVVRGQLNFMLDSSLGFDKEQIAIVELWNSREAESNPEILKSGLLVSPHIQAVTSSNSVPGKFLLNRVGYPDNNESLSKVMFSLIVNDDFLDLYDLEIIEGRAFSTEVFTDQTQAFILNESAVKEFGWSKAEAIGRDFQWGSRAGKIIGVTKDFHYYSLQEKIPPMILLPSAGNGDFMSIKITQNIRETVAFIQETWETLYPDRTFSMYFLDDSFNDQYELESQLDNIMSLFTLVAIFIACSGLFSLTAVHVEHRTKEIGIRKVLGASVVIILSMISKFFLRLVAIAILLAIPLAYLLTDWWLSDFAYRMDLSPLIFLLATVFALAIACLTVCIQSYKTAMVNPVDTLRYE